MSIPVAFEKSALQYSDSIVSGKCTVTWRKGQHLSISGSHQCTVRCYPFISHRICRSLLMLLIMMHIIITHHPADKLRYMALRIQKGSLLGKGRRSPRRGRESQRGDTSDPTTVYENSRQGRALPAPLADGGRQVRCGRRAGGV